MTSGRVASRVEELYQSCGGVTSLLWSTQQATAGQPTQGLACRTHRSQHMGRLHIRAQARVCGGPLCAATGSAGMTGSSTLVHASDHTTSPHQHRTATSTTTCRPPAYHQYYHHTTTSTTTVIDHSHTNNSRHHQHQQPPPPLGSGALVAAAVALAVLEDFPLPALRAAESSVPAASTVGAVRLQQRLRSSPPERTHRLHQARCWMSLLLLWLLLLWRLSRTQVSQIHVLAGGICPCSNNGLRSCMQWRLHGRPPGEAFRDITRAAS